MPNTRLSISEQLEALLPEIQDNAKRRGVELEREGIKEQIDWNIDNGDKHDTINGIIKFTDRFIFQPNTVLEHHKNYFLWATTNNLYNQIKRIEENQIKNKDNDRMENKTPKTLQALREYFNAYKNGYEKNTGKSWRPQRKYLDTITEQKDESGRTTTTRLRILSPEKKILILTGSILEEEQTHKLMDQIKKKHEDFLLIRTDNSEADTAMSTWFEKNIHNATAKEMVVGYDYSQKGDPITPVFDQFLALRPDEVIILERSVLNNDFVEYAEEQGIELNSSYPQLLDAITKETSDITQ